MECASTSYESVTDPEEIYCTTGCIEGKAETQSSSKTILTTLARTPFSGHDTESTTEVMQQSLKGAVS